MENLNKEAITAEENISAVNSSMESNIQSSIENNNSQANLEDKSPADFSSAEASDKEKGKGENIGATATSSRREDRRTNSAVRYLVGVALFSALAYAVGTLCEAFMPKVLFLSVDMKDAVITIGAFIFGPLSAIPMSILSVFLQTVTLGFPTGPIGMVQDLVSTLVFSLVASLIYNKWRSIKGMVLGFSVTTLAYVLAMVPMNILLTPIFTGAERAYIIALLPKVFIPFNFAKSLLDSAACLILYKPISQALSTAGLIRRKERSMKINKVFFITLTAAALLVALTLLIFLMIVYFNPDLA